MICSMSAGTVAENRSCWQSFGRLSRIRVLLEEPHVQHLVLLVEAAPHRVVELQRAAADVIVDAARRPDDDLGARLELELLAHRRRRRRDDRQIPVLGARRTPPRPGSRAPASGT